MKTKDEISLKFGCIKGGNFSNNPIALATYDKCNSAESDDERKQIELQVIDEFDGKIFNWWDQRYVSKQEAKDYILNYGE